MIADYYNRLLVWVQERTLREKILTVLVGWAVIYLFWYLLCSRPLLIQGRLLDEKIKSITAETKGLQEQAQFILDFASKNATSQKLMQQQKFVTQSKNLKERLENSVLATLNESEVTKVVSDILKLPKPGIELINLKDLAHDSLIPSGIDSSSLPVSLTKLSRFNMQIDFRGDYFSSINYLTRLEKLSWRLYLDSLDYKVTTYPQANAVILFYILVNKAS